MFALAQDEPRIWSDKSGKHEIRAKFIDIQDGVVRLERPNGDISRIPIAKLSKEDQTFIRGANKKQKNQLRQAAGLAIGDQVEAEHFGSWVSATVTSIDYEWERVEVRTKGRTRMDWPKSLDDLRYPGTDRRPNLVRPVDPSDPLGGDSIDIALPDMSDMARLVADGSPAGNAAPDPGPARSAGWKPRAVRLGSAEDFFEGVADFSIVDASPPLAMLLYANNRPGGDRPSRVELVNLQTRKVLVAGNSPPNTKKVFLSPSGRLVATIPEPFHGKDGDGRIDIWKIDGGKVSHSISFAPYRMNTWPKHQVEWLDWLDDERLFTTNQAGKTILWQVAGAKAVYELLTGRQTLPMLTPGRKQLVVPTSAGIQFVDASSGDLLAQVGTGDFRHAALAFSPTGRLLAAASGNFIDIVDIAAGKSTRSFPCDGASAGRGLWWIDEEHLFVANQIIVDVSRRIPIWNYEVSGKVVKRAAGTQWALLENRSEGLRLLQPFELPPPESVRAVADLSDDELLVVQPGMSVSIDVKINDSIIATEVSSALQKGLTESGLRVAQQEQPLRLVARMNTGDTEEVSYRSWGIRNRINESFEVTKRIYELELLLDGVPIWKRESIQSPPYHINLKRGETIRAAVDRAMKPHSGSFRGRLPAYVVRPEFREPLGSSKLSIGP